MKLNRPLVSLDTETTGTDTSSDSVIEVGCKKISPDETSEVKRWLVNPGRPIPPESTAVHNITDEMVANCPTFSEVAFEILDFIEGCDICGYNARFDISILMREFSECPHDAANVVWPAKDCLVLDPGNIFKKKEPRTLSAAVQKYCDREHVGAHGAVADCEATLDVLEEQVALYPDLADMTPTELSAFCEMEPRVDWAGKLTKDKNGDVCYSFGKAKGRRVVDDPGFGQWMMRNNFPKETLNCLSSILYPNAPENAQKGLPF
jgi:DNA polymerase-3 subunit epsilon